MTFARIQIWYIYHVEKCVHTRPKPKDKFVIIACLDSKPMGFLINSTINAFIADNPTLSKCQAAISKDDHRSLPKNSFVDCKEIFPFDDWELKKRGAVSLNAKRNIVRAVDQCLVLEKKYKRMILENERETLDQIRKGD